jgi:hypothetical protein
VPTINSQSFTTCNHIQDFKASSKRKDIRHLQFSRFWFPERQVSDLILAIHTVTPGHACHWLTRLPSSTPSTAWSTLAYVQPMYGVSTFCLEGCGQRRNIHVSQLPSLPACKGPQATSSSTLHHSSPSKQILSCACGPGGSSTCFFGGPCWPLLTGQTGGWKLRNCATWRPAGLQMHSLPTVLHILACRPLWRQTGVANAPPLYGHLPARGRAFSTCSPTSTTLRARATGWWSRCTADQRCLVCMWCRPIMALPPTLGAVGDMCSNKGEVCCLISRACKKIPPQPPRLGQTRSS